MSDKPNTVQSKLTEPLLPNPNAYIVRVGDIVHTSVGNRAVQVAKRDSHGAVWEQIEPNHPAYKGPESIRYIGIEYNEFEPAFIPAERLQALFTHPAPKLGYL